ncbi:MAG: DUF3850 domain-containing protein [Waterburya sp.]
MKSINPYFEDVYQGRRKAEIRKNDRQFQVDDGLLLLEFEPHQNLFLDRSITLEITHILDDETYLQPGHIMMSVEEL